MAKCMPILHDFWSNGHAKAMAERLQEAGGASAACPLRGRFDAEGGAQQVTPMSEVDAWRASVKALLEA